MSTMLPSGWIDGSSSSSNQIFTMFDIEKKDSLDMEQFKSALDFYSIEPSGPLVEYADTDTQGVNPRISKKSFTSCVSGWQKQRGDDEEAKWAYTILRGDSPSISKVRLLELATIVELNMTKQELEEMVDAFDEDADGQIGVEDFVGMLQYTGR